MLFPIFKSQSKKAIQECLKQVEAFPKDKRLLLKLGDLYLRNGDERKAIQEYLRVADFFSEEDLNARAIGIYKRVLSIDPKHIEALRRIATLYSKDGLWGSAKACYEKILEIRSSDQEAMKALSAIEDSKQPKKAQTRPQIEEALPVKPGDALPPSPSRGMETPLPDKDLELHYHLGIGYKQMGLFDYAIAEFELASEDLSMRFDCYIMLGECFKEKGDSEQSKKYFALASNIGELPKGLLQDRTSRRG